MLRDHRSSSRHLSTSILAAMRVAVEQHIKFAISESYLQFISTPALEMSFSGKLCILIYARLSRAVSGLECVFVVNNKGASWNTGWARLVPGTLSLIHI